MTADEKAAVVRQRVCLRDGELWWVKADRPVKLWADKEGYLRFTIKVGSTCTLRFGAHRVIWLLHYGRWPAQEIDHINRDPADNCIENLRDVSRLENVRNQKAKARATRRPATPRSPNPYRGVHWHKRDKRWIAFFDRNGKRIHLGSCGDRETALALRQKAEIEHASGVSPLFHRWRRAAVKAVARTPFCFEVIRCPAP